MNLLLLLSALLSALTGVSASARAMPAATEQAAVAVRAASTQRAVVTRRPVAAPPTLPALAVAPLADIWSLAATVPLFAERRRE